MISHSSAFLTMDTQATSARPSIRMAQSTLEKWKKIKSTDLEFTLTPLAEGMRVSLISILLQDKPRFCTQTAHTTSAIPRKWWGKVQAVWFIQRQGSSMSASGTRISRKVLAIILSLMERFIAVSTVKMLKKVLENIWHQSQTWSLTSIIRKSNR